MVDPPSTDRTDANDRRNVANAGRVDTGVDTLDLPRAIALATALDAFIRTGMTDHARPLAAELVALLRAAEGAGATVVSIGMPIRLGPAGVRDDASALSSS
jgi:hypothetical protein